MCHDIGRLMSMEAAADSQIGRLWKIYKYIFTLTEMDNYIQGNRLQYIENVQALFHFTEKGQITYKGLGAIRSTNGLRLLNRLWKGRLVTLTMGITIPSLHGHTACCTVALANYCYVTVMLGKQVWFRLTL
jgi:hypothetical protein